MKTGFSSLCKESGRPRGKAGRARTRSGDGEGGRDRERVAPLWLPSARGRRGNGRARVAQRDPKVWVGLRLALDEVIAGLRPEQDVGALVVQDELALVGLDRKHRVTVAVEVADHRHQKRL